MWGFRTGDKPLSGRSTCAEALLGTVVDRGRVKQRPNPLNLAALSSQTQLYCVIYITPSRFPNRLPIRRIVFTTLVPANMSEEQQRPGSALTGGLEGSKILPRLQDHVTFSSPSDSIPATNIARRLRACVACKESKVKCKRDEERPEASCERCVSAGRQCIASVSARNKRPRRNISTVASLESKVDALVAALKEKQAGDVEEYRGMSPVDPMLG